LHCVRQFSQVAPKIVGAYPADGQQTIRTRYVTHENRQDSRTVVGELQRRIARRVAAEGLFSQGGQLPRLSCWFVARALAIRCVDADKTHGGQRRFGVQARTDRVRCADRSRGQLPEDLIGVREAGKDAEPVMSRALKQLRVGAGLQVLSERMVRDGGAQQERGEHARDINGERATGHACACTPVRPETPHHSGTPAPDGLEARKS
jgi:hypothetical protein